jgi:hypothetical protein
MDVKSFNCSYEIHFRIHFRDPICSGDLDHKMHKEAASDPKIVPEAGLCTYCTLHWRKTTNSRDEKIEIDQSQRSKAGTEILTRLLRAIF